MLTLCARCSRRRLCGLKKIPARTKYTLNVSVHEHVRGDVDVNVVCDPKLSEKLDLFLAQSTPCSEAAQWFENKNSSFLHSLLANRPLHDTIMNKKAHCEIYRDKNYLPSPSPRRPRLVWPKLSNFISIYTPRQSNWYAVLEQLPDHCSAM